MEEIDKLKIEIETLKEQIKIFKEKEELENRIVDEDFIYSCRINKERINIVLDRYDKHGLNADKFFEIISIVKRLCELSGTEKVEINMRQ